MQDIWTVHYIFGGKLFLCYTVPLHMSSASCQTNDILYINVVKSFQLLRATESWPLLSKADVSSPPPMHWPLMNTRGTELAPVICRRYAWISEQSRRFSISITSYWSGLISLPTCGRNAFFAMEQYGQYVFEKTTTFFPWIFILTNCSASSFFDMFLVCVGGWELLRDRLLRPTGDWANELCWMAA